MKTNRLLLKPFYGKVVENLWYWIWRQIAGFLFQTPLLHMKGRHRRKRKNICLSNSRHHRNIETDSHHHACIENDHYNLTTRSEKEALKKRKKRTPTVAMTAEQYKAKRGIFLSTPKKTGRHLTEASISVFVFASFLALSFCVGFIFLKKREAFRFTPQRKHRSIQHCSCFNLCVSVLCS